MAGQVNDPHPRSGHAGDLLDETAGLDLAVGDEAEPEQVAVEGKRPVSVRAGDREVVDPGDHRAGGRPRLRTRSFGSVCSLIA